MAKLDKKVEIENAATSENELKLQITLKQMEQEHELKLAEISKARDVEMKQMELKIKELEKQEKGQEKFDATKYLNVVPEFTEDEVDAFFHPL